ncbi:hypothetical protein D1115_06470 [Vibrio alfacsensis]|uniref:CRISPR type III-associated protein domain-containing protein n=1 Tax=Vibrio alfacsensis TaxID=1074311 RepID=A0ABN5PF49_9VIBR|nr:RAMP superfamily CRISPR-associated protein [Vibrio alfacsensis]AXY00923.1 hypothetical protein D1115_06470 [Vibrio alfacsensis]
MTIKLTLQFDIQSHWHIGSGNEGGAYADALALKDEQGLPYIPGRSVKGLLREAMTLACENQWFEDDKLTHLFGEEGNNAFTQGKISVSNASFSAAEKVYFGQQKGAKKHLYQVVHSTAIEHTTGVAKNTSLRSLEVVIPLTLSAQVMVNGTKEDAQAIMEVLPLITHLGAKRHRGLGQVFVTASTEGAN